jgi:hypothetical protein
MNEILIWANFIIVIIWLMVLTNRINKALEEPKSYYIDKIQTMNLLGSTTINNKTDKFETEATHET